MDFEKIYFQANVKPLFERVLREAENEEIMKSLPFHKQENLHVIFWD
jgi:hypothetical protein